MDSSHVLTALLRNAGAVLVLRRSDETGANGGRWAGLTSHADGEFDRDALDRRTRATIREQSGLDGELTLVRTGESFVVEERRGGEEDGAENRRVVHPYLFDATTREVTLESGTDWEWLRPTEIRRRETMPGLRESYERVAPTVETIATDRERGSAALSTSALTVLRDRAGVLADRAQRGRDRREANGEDGEDDGGDPWTELAILARALRSVRPSMVAIGNRVNRAMATADDRTPSAVEAATQEVIERAASADEAAAAVAAEALADLEASAPLMDENDGNDEDTDDDSPDACGPRVLTLSRSGTVIEALRALEPPPREVVIAESRPGGEGHAVAAELASTHPVTLVADAGVAHALGSGGGDGRGGDGGGNEGSGASSRERAIDAVLVGSDTIYPDGSVLNKVGTRGAAIAAAYEGIPVYVVAASAKISPELPAEPDLEAGERERLYAGEIDVEELNPTFDVTPADIVTGVCTERGMLEPDDIETLAEEFAALAAWDVD
ncbi:initiation factor 2B [Halobacteriales archaeon QS_3_64_16]|nr:MAG: initiation factor 2B [Halobacteriales archaeon QS_3_64_16]